MKKILAIIIILCLVLSMIGCNKEKEINETVKEQEDSQNVKDNEIEDDEEESLEELSKAFAVQMANGEFKNLRTKFSSTMKKQLNEANLKEAWNVAVAELGSYLGIHDCIIEEVDNYLSISVILKYENNGFSIQFVYNQSEQIDGLWFKYYYIEDEIQGETNYNEIDVSIGGGPYLIDGIITLPLNVGKPPVVILVHGSGTHDMDETIGAVSNKPFRDIARGLAEQGIASIRYNERYYQYPELISETPTIYDDSLFDVADVIAFATESNLIDTNQIYILGHSLGGMLAPKIANDHKEVKGIISLAGSPRRLEDIIYDQNIFFLNLDEDLSAEEKETLLMMVEDEIDKIRNLQETDDSFIFGINSSYWHSLNQICTPTIVSDLNIPMLIMQGSEDFQVYVDKDYTAWQELLGNRDNVSFILYENLNHLFMVSNGIKDITEYNMKGNVDQQVILDIASWVRSIN